MAAKEKRRESKFYKPEIIEEILGRLASGESLRAICSEDGKPSASVFRGWVVDDLDGLAERYARARDIGVDAMADDMLEIADDGTNDWMERNDPDNPGYIINWEHVQRSRLRVESRKWYLAKLAPKKYGDKLEVGGKVEGGFALVLKEREK